MQKDRKFILTVSLIVITAKIIIAVLYFHFWLLPGKQDVIGPDGEGFSQRAWYISRVLKGAADYTAPTGEYVFKDYYRVVDAYGGHLPPVPSRGNNAFTYFISLVYYVFGYSPLLIKTFNILVSAVSSVLVYMLALEVCNRNVARISFALFTFFPTIFIFSISMLRDPLIVSCAVSIIYALIQLQKNMDSRFLLLLAAALTAMLFLRQELFLVMALVSAIMFVMNKNLKYKTLVLSAVIGALLLVTNLGIFEAIRYRPAVLVRNAAPIIFTRHASAYFVGGRLAYRIFPERYYSTYEKESKEKRYLDSDEKISATEFLRYLPKAILFYMTRPFPFMYREKTDDLISIYMMWWYAVLALSAFGVLATRFRSGGAVFIYLALALVVMSMGYANEGILLRHRDCVVPFFIIFAAAALDKILKALSAKFNFFYG